MDVSKAAGRTIGQITGGMSTSQLWLGADNSCQPITNSQVEAAPAEARFIGYHPLHERLHSWPLDANFMETMAYCYPLLVLNPSIA